MKLHTAAFALAIAAQTQETLSFSPTFSLSHKSLAAVNRFRATSTRVINAARSEPQSCYQHRTYKLQLALGSSSTNSEEKNPITTETDEKFDTYLQEPSLSKAIQFLEDNPAVKLTRERWSSVFSAIERRTTEAEENAENKRLLETTSQYQIQSPARNEMTKLYELLSKLNHLRLFGAAKQFQPASGSHTVTPVLLEQITGLNMLALTPKPTNSLLLAGAALAVSEGLASLAMGWDLNFLTFMTLALAVLDRIATNGAVSESFVKLFNPGVQQKIVRHEAGHFLVAYLLGLPVEGCVLSAWAALQDARFDKRQVSAGTSFFDPELSHQINSSVVTRSSIDRYSMVVMAGIAAEAIHFGRADGGAGDEMALVAFLSQLNGRSTQGTRPAWNNDSIRNQARWGALQAILLLREYKDSFEALVDALERGGDLGDCIYAIEKTGRERGLEPLKRPVGFIVDDGINGSWTTEFPADVGLGDQVLVPLEDKPKVWNEEETMLTLQDYRRQVEERLKEIDEQLKQIAE